MPRGMDRMMGIVDAAGYRGWVEIEYGYLNKWTV